jgi:predicted metal-dependent enzyme (double-stranded beta helix superfamily)
MDRRIDSEHGDPATADGPVRRLLERIAAPAALAVPDLLTIGAALTDLASDLEYVTRWSERLGDRNGLLPIHAPARGPRLSIVHRRKGHLSAVHDHGTWVALSPVSGLETHRRYRLTDGPERRPEVIEVVTLEPAETATLLPPDDVHDHGHLAGRGVPAHVLILTGDDQRRFERNEWDPATGRHRVLPAGDLGRWLASDPWP